MNEQQASVVRRNEQRPQEGERPRVQKFVSDIADIFKANIRFSYDKFGNRNDYQKNEPFVSRFSEKVVAVARSLDPENPTNILGKMKMALPLLVRALVESGIDGMYQQSEELDPREEIANIALDWFINPQEVGQTVFHVVYGGDSRPSSRAPAYMIPPLHAISAIQNAYSEYRGWAIAQEQAKKFRQQAEEQPKNILHLVQQAEMQSLHPDEIQQIEKDYRVARVFPQLVISNTVHSGASLNGNSEEQRANMRAFRDKTQELLREFINRFFPNIPNQVAFINDMPWDNNPSVKAQLAFFQEFVAKQAKNHPEIVDAQALLAAFGENHNNGLENSVAPIYPFLHGWFFADDNNLPPVSVMQHPLPARNIINFISRSEVTFNVIRKAMSQATIDDYIAWLQDHKQDALLAEALLWKAQEKQPARRSELVVKVGKTPVYYPVDNIDDVWQFSFQRYKNRSVISQSSRQFAPSEEKQALQGYIDQSAWLVDDIEAILKAINPNSTIAEQEYKKLLKETFGNSSRREVRK